MLNFSLEVKLGIKETSYPILFDRKNVCIHCGTENSLTIVDKFGNETKQEIHPFDYIRCRNCGRHYSIKWESDPDNNGKMYPIASDRSIKREFINLINHSSIKNNAII